LGIPFPTRKIAKMKWCQAQLSKMHHKATKIAESGLKMTQVIASIITCGSKTTLANLDIYFRQLVNGKIGGIPMTYETFYIQVKDCEFQ
jgi:hypothetical protein